MFKERIPADISESRYTGTDNDQSLNYSSDLVPDIQQQLRQVKWESSLARAPEMAGAALSAVLLGAACGYLLKGKLLKASLCVTGFLYQQGLKEQISPNLSLNHLGVRERKELELERYALKAQRGDYGKLEVIPFR